MKNVDYHDLRAFVSVATARSFRGAAALGAGSASGLSESVRRLETALGVRLLNRTTRSVTPTDAGARLLERLGGAFGEVEAALGALHAESGAVAGVLRLNVPTIAARVVLPSILARFLAAYPEVRVEVRAEDRFSDVLAAGFDAGVRYEERLEQDMIAVPIGPRTQSFACAAAPAYLAAHGRPEHPRDLVRHAAVRHRFPSGAMPDWEFERAGEVIRVSPPPRAVADSLDLELALAVGGAGVMLSFAEVLAPALADGRLEPLLTDWTQPFSGPFLYFPSRRLMPVALRAFVDFVRESPPETGAAPSRVPPASARP